MRDETLCIRRMKPDEVGMAIQWAAREGWNPGLHDADCFYAADPNGFFIAEVNGDPAGCISAVAYDDHFGFLGFYIVRPDLRHHGVGFKLWDTALKYMGQRTAGGDAVVAMVAKYEQDGFKVSYNNARFEGVGVRSSVQLPPVTAVDFAELERFDHRFFLAPRREFLRHWISRPGTQTRAVIADGRLKGYGVIRPCHTGFKIAPLFADDAEAGGRIFESLASVAEGQPVFLDIPISNREALSLVERHGMKKVFETARIYNGPAPRLPLNAIYGITSFELG